MGRADPTSALIYALLEAGWADSGGPLPSKLHRIHPLRSSSQDVSPTLDWAQQHSSNSSNGNNGDNMHASADASCVQGTGLVLPNWFVLGVTVGTHAALTQQQLSSLCKGLYVKRCNFYCHARAVAAGAAQTACPVETTLASRFDSVLTCSPLTRHPYTGNLHSETPGDSKRCVSTQWRCFERHSCQQTEQFF